MAVSQPPASPDYRHVVIGCGDGVVHDPAPTSRAAHGLTGPVPPCGKFVALMIRL